MFGSLSFWVTFAIVLALLVTEFVLLERRKHNRPTQHRGVVPNGSPTLIVSDVSEARFSRVAHAYHVTADPQAYAKAFVPSDHKD